MNSLMTNRALKYFEPEGWDEITQEVRENADQLMMAETPIAYPAGPWGVWHAHLEGEVGVSLSEVVPKLYDFLHDRGIEIWAWFINRIKITTPEDAIVNGRRTLHVDYVPESQTPPWKLDDYSPERYPLVSLNTPLYSFEGDIWISSYEIPDKGLKNCRFMTDNGEAEYSDNFHLSHFSERIAKLDCSSKTILLNGAQPHEVVKATPGRADRLILRFKDNHKAMELFDV